MATRGTVAKNEVIKKLQEAFGSDYIGEIDKKIYVYANDGGERVQIAISLTCPKTNANVEQAVRIAAETEEWSWEESPAKKATPPTAEISQQERQNVADLMARLGL
jgi:hypothetical protein